MQKKMKFLSLFLSVALLVTGIAPVEAAAYATPAFSTNQVMTLDDQTITPANPEDPQDLQNPQSPENPEDIQNPQSPENPEDPQNPQTPVTPVNPEIPETPQEPETPAISENEIPETPDVTELPETLDVSVSENVISENELPLAGTLSAEQVLAKRELVADIKTVAEAKEGTDYVAGEVLYLCDDSKQAEEAAAAYGATVKSFNNGVAVLLIPKEQTVKAVMNTAADQTNQLPAVYPNYYRRLLSETPANESFTDPYTKTQSEYYQYYHELVNSKYVWKAAESKKTGINERLGDIVVAVLDSGINTAHEDFEGVIVDAKAMVDGVTPEDENGHGSNVAGIIANKANDKGGRGVAAGVKIMSLRLSEAGEEGDITDAAVIAAINYASNPDDEFDVRVMNMSIGDEKYSSIYQEPIKKARQNGIVVVAAAGNGSTDGDICPACIDGVVSVGSVNSEYQKSNFSNYGPHVDISAPGGDINPDLTQPGYIRAERNWASGHVREGKVNTYLSMAGTSQASPIVAAAAALVIANDDEYFNMKQGEYIADKVENQLKATSKKINSNYAMGAGCVDIAAALGLSTDLPAPGINTEPGSTIASGSKLELLAPDGNTDAGIYYTVNGKTPDPEHMDATGTLLYNSETKVTATGAGNFTLKTMAVLYGVSTPVATYSYKFSDSQITDINLYTDHNQTTLAIGKTVKIKADIVPSYAKNKKLIWESLDTSVATVTADGVVKGISSGSTIITATATDGSETTGTFYIRIHPVFSRIEYLEPGPIMMKIGDTFQTDLLDIVAVPITDSTDFLLSSSNPKVVCILEDGYIKAVGNGTAMITIKANDSSNVKTTIGVNVSTPVLSIQIADKANRNKVAATKKLTPVVTFNEGDSNPNNTNLTWTIEAGAEYATINKKNGIVTIKKGLTQPKEMKIKAVSNEDTSVFATYDFTAYPLTTKITLVDEEKAVLPYGMATPFAKFIKNAAPCSEESSETYTMNEFKCTSSNPSVVYVDQANGKLVGLQYGSCKITITALDGSNKSASCTVKVIGGKGGYAVTSKEKTKIIYPGKKVTLIASRYPDKTLKFTGEWTLSSSPDICKETEYLKISDQGVITTKDAAFGTIQEKIIQPVSFVVADPSSGEKEVVAAAEFELYPVKVTEVQAQKSMFLNLSTKKQAD